MKGLRRRDEGRPVLRTEMKLCVSKRAEFLAEDQTGLQEGFCFVELSLNCLSWHLLRVSEEVGRLFFLMPVAT